MGVLFHEQGDPPQPEANNEEEEVEVLACSSSLCLEVPTDIYVIFVAYILVQNLTEASADVGEVTPKSDVVDDVKVGPSESIFSSTESEGYLYDCDSKISIVCQVAAKP